MKNFLQAALALIIGGSGKPKSLPGPCQGGLKKVKSAMAKVSTEEGFRVQDVGFTGFRRSRMYWNVKRLCAQSGCGVKVC